MKINKLFFAFSLLIMFWLLSACAEVSATPANDTTQQIAPNIAAVNAAATVQALSVQSTAAQLQVDLLNQQSTSTSAAGTAIAFAPFATATQVAVELQVQRMYSDATSTSAAATQTAYMMQQAYNAQATTTAGVATQIAQVTQQAFAVQVNNDQLALERAQTVNKLKALSLYGVGIVVMILAVAGAYVLIKRLAVIPNPVDERGKAMPMIEVIEGTSWDIERATNGMIGIGQKFLKALPTITADRQNEVTARAQLVDMQTRVARLPKRLLETQGQGLLMEPAAEEDIELDPANKLALPPWEFINDWKGDSRPLGFGLKGLITAAAASPHLLVSGKTGTGKTGFMLRTQATASLAKGYQVINLGFSDSGFGVFSGHPNYFSVKLEQASDLIPCLSSVYKELKERKQIIGGESIEWDHWPTGNPPRPFVDLLIDELGNIAEDIYASEDTARNGSAKTKELWRWISMIANEGRKVGIRFIAALQDPTAKSVDLRFRRNCTLVSFQQGDASQSSAFLGAPGAEHLHVGHFMARIDGLVIGGGFSPNDDEIKHFLNQRIAKRMPAPDWIDGVIVNQPALPKQESIRLSAPAAPAPAISRATFVNGLHEWEAKVLDLYESGLDQSQIVESVFAGDDPIVGKVAVADLIQRWQVIKNAGTTAYTTTTTETNDQPVSEEEKIKNLASQGKTPSAIVKEIWGVTGGAKFNPLVEKVKSLITSGSTSMPQIHPESA